MKRIFIGHRGVGKTSLLARHKEYFPEVKHFDLDAEISLKAQSSLKAFFEKNGEPEFRKLEAEVFTNLTQNESSYVLAVGAGFDVTKIPKDAEIIFVSRRTDRDGRIFKNRPRLEPALSPLDEFKKRFDERQEKFLNAADWIYRMPEGISHSNETEKQILTGRFLIADAYYTLTSQDLVQLPRITSKYKKIELRTDLLAPSEIEKIVTKYKDNELLISIRNADPVKETAGCLVDCDYLHLNRDCNIVSSHTDKIQTGIKQLSEFSKTHLLKLCPQIESFDDLRLGYEWQQKDPLRRSFLPRSLNGKWSWFRILSKYLQNINFVKSFTDISDQPSLYEWLLLPVEKPAFWAAIMGSPVHFSRSPVQHEDFFKKRNSFLVRLDISPEELAANLSFLQLLGLKYAAVTSPLKERFAESANRPTELVIKLKAANTLFISNGSIQAHNTDFEGFFKLSKNLKSSDRVVVWGGGGTLAMMKSALPKAHFFSSQTGGEREPQVEQITEFDYLIWAAPRSHRTQFPSNRIKVNHVLDLNYSENSMGLEFAAERNIGYTSGQMMFQTQAEEQQKFWIQCEETL